MDPVRSCPKLKPDNPAGGKSVSISLPGGVPEGDSAGRASCDGEGSDKPEEMRAIKNGAKDHELGAQGSCRDTRRRFGSGPLTKRFVCQEIPCRSLFSHPRDVGGGMQGLVPLSR